MIKLVEGKLYHIQCINQPKLANLFFSLDQNKLCGSNPIITFNLIIKAYNNVIKANCKILFLA